MTQQVNLIDASLLPPKRLLTARSVLAVWIAGTVAVCSHLAWERHAMGQALAAEPGTAAESSEAAGDLADTEQAGLQRQIAQREALRRLLKQSGQTPSAGAALLSQVIQALPETIWLTQIDLAGAQSIRIAGGAVDPTALTTFADRLARIPALRGVPIEAVRIEPSTPDGSDESAPRPEHHSFVLASSQATGGESR